MKKILILAVGIFTYLGLNAQSESFPLYFSQYGLNGTSAYIGKAGAIGALGGDIMSSNYNPAGLGLYRASEITFTSGIDITSSSANFNGMKTSDSHPTFNFGNLGMVVDFNNGSSSPFRHVQMSFGLNRLVNFNNRTKIARNNLASSYIDDNALNLITSIDDDFIAAGVVDTFRDANGDLYTSSVYENGTFNQIKSVRESGYLNEMSFSLSTNYENWLYLGATIGIPFGEYTCKTSFSEERFVSGVSTGYYNYNTQQDLSVAGVNLKLGAIVRPVQWLRIGAAIHTPTFYNVTDDFYSEVEYNKRSGGWWPQYEYNMQSPWRFIGSAAVILGNNTSKVSGTISLDYELASYSAMSMTLEDNIMTETTLNNAIDANYSSASTVRLGGEVKYGRLRARAGYAYFGNPYKEKEINNAAWNYLTCGVGYRGKTYFFDIGYAYGKLSDGKYYMYDTYDNGQWSSDANPSKISTTKHLLQATLGVRF